MAFFRSIALAFSFVGVAGWAQSPDLQQLQDRMQQLDQMMRDLKQQIDQVENAQNTPASPSVTPRGPETAKVPTPQVPTDHIGNLTLRRDAGNDNSASGARINNEEIDPALRGYFRLPGTGTLVKLDGFIKTDILVDANQ